MIPVPNDWESVLRRRVIPPPPDLGGELAVVLLRRAQSLLAGLPDNQGVVPDCDGPSRAELRRVVRSLHGKIGTHFVAAMLCSAQGDADALAGHVLHGSMHALEDRECAGLAEEACRHVRLLHWDTRADLRARLLELDYGSSEAVLNSLIEQRAALRDNGVLPGTRARLDRQLGHLYGLLNYLVTGEVSRSPPPRDPLHRTSETEAYAQTEVADVSVLHFNDDHSEAEIDGEPALLDVKPAGSDAHQHSHTIQRYHAIAARSHIVRGYMCSPCRWGVLSPFSLDTLVRTLKEGMDAGDPADALIFASLLTGRSARDLNELRIWAGAAGPGASANPGRDEKASRLTLLADEQGLYLRAGLDLPRPKLEAALRELYAPADPFIRLPLPGDVHACLEFMEPTYVAITSLQLRLKTLREAIPQVTEARIRSAGRLWLYHNNHERTTLDRLFGTHLAHAVPLYYEHMKASRVLKAYRAWTARLDEAVGGKGFTYAWRPASGRIGSRRTPVLGVLKRNLAECRDQVELTLRTRMGSAEAHNHYAVYTYLLLAVATGIRPGRQAFETFDDFCTATNVYLIEDKDVGGQDSPRYVTVANVGVRQLEHYRAYLSRLVMHLSNEVQRHYVEAALNGRVCFLFTLDGLDGEPEPMIPSRTAALLQRYIPLELYALRHLLRTELIDRGVHDEVVQATMGHGEMGQEPFARYSGLSMKDLDAVAESIDAIAGEERPPRGRAASAASRRGLRIAPLRYAPVNAGRVPPGRHVPTEFPYKPQSRRNRELRRRELQVRAMHGKAWVEERVREARNDAERLREPEVAKRWAKGTMTLMEKALPKKHEFMAARRRLPVLVNELNLELGTAIPVQTAPRVPRPANPMHNGVSFRARRIVQRAAEHFLRCLAERGRVAGADASDLAPLVLFSAASFGALADPMALAAFAEALRSRSVTLNYANLGGRQTMCWLNLHYETNRANNVVIDGELHCQRRFFVDGTTLMLLILYLRTDIAASGGYSDPRAVYRDIETGVNRFCARRVLPHKLSLERFCLGAISVAESQPGVELPHYLVEYACGRIDSVSLPQAYFLAYLGKVGDAGRAEATGDPPEAKSADRPGAGTDREIDAHVEGIRSLFAGLREMRPGRAKRTVRRRIAALRDRSTSDHCRLLCDYFAHLYSTDVAVMTPARYSNWISTGWLLEFEGVDLKKLDGEDWFDGYEAVVEQEPVNRQADVAGRLMAFHRFLVQERGYAAVPTDLARLYRGKRFVRARAIPESHFSAFIDELQATTGDGGDGDCIRWVFTLCYRLGTRIGELTRVRFMDIEESDDPLIFLRANWFGNTKTKMPHQLPLSPFLTADEKDRFLAWVKVRRRGSAPDDPVFAPVLEPDSVWDTRSLATLFTTAMFRVAGIRYSPHSCRHSLASKLLWLAEDEAPPGESPFTVDERQALKEAVFTKSPGCRDRIWHLSAVFNHADPGTTLGTYVHVMDWMVCRKLGASRRRFDAEAFQEIVGIGEDDIGLNRLQESAGVLVERVLPVLVRRCGEHFNRIDIGRKRGRKRRRPRPETKGGNAAYRYDVLQWVLEDLENGIDEIEVARSFGVGDEWLGCVRDAARALLELRTRTGKRRLFGSNRLAETAQPLSPTRGAGPTERVLDAALGALVRAKYQADPSAIRFACAYWLNHVTAARPDVPFHNTGDLRTFLETFKGIGLKALSLDRLGGADWRQPHWALRVWLPDSENPERLLDAWRVFGGVAVSAFARYRRPRPQGHPQGAGAPSPWFPNARNHPNGIAYLYLDKGAGPQGEPRRNSSRALGCILHRGNVLLATDDLMKKRPSDRHRLDAES